MGALPDAPMRKRHEGPGRGALQRKSASEIIEEMNLDGKSKAKLMRALHRDEAALATEQASIAHNY